MTITRRRFLGTTCAAAAALAVPRWAAAGPLRIAPSVTSDNILVIVTLEGGNDGLNTFVPIGDHRYENMRRTVALAPSQTIRVDGQTGFHPSLSHLARRMNEGRLAVIEGVGYPVPDLSHFRSMDVWHSAVSEGYETSGWLGRTLDHLYGNEPAATHSLAFGYAVPPAFQSSRVATPAIYDISSFDFRTDDWYPEDDPAKRAALQTIVTSLGVPAHDFIAQSGSLALSDSSAIRAAIDAHSGPEYPDSDVGRGLRYTAAVIAAGLGPRVFWIAQGGYDTHDSQRGLHDDLLRDLDRSLNAFEEDLRRTGNERRVVTMGWSEFGRRVEDNGSGGTDHGTAGPAFVLGVPVRGGFFGRRPSLADLDEYGNLKYTIDFRNIYTTLLRNWIGVDPALVIAGSYDTLPFLG